MYGMEDQQCDGVVQSELLCGGRQGGCGCEGEGAFDVQGRDRPYPHPRSAEFIEGLAAYHGGQWGLMYAEAFEVLMREY